jgi:BCCT family betaine/carnitine transporter
MTGTEYETDYTLGQDNVRNLGFDVHNPVFAIAAGVIIVFVVLSLSFPEQAAEIFSATRNWTTIKLDWLFVISANIFLVACLVLMVSPYG